MDFRQLSYFIALADEGNFHRAAERVGLTQSALTQSIAKLEEQVGVRLFTRARSGSTLTEHGQRLYEHAQVILAQVRAAQAELAVRSGRGRTELLLGVVPSLADDLLLELLDRITSVERGHAIKIVKDWSSDLAPMLERGEIDLAFLSDHLMPDPLPEIHRHPLFYDRVQVVVGSPHPLHAAPEPGLAELAEHEWVAVSIEPRWPQFLARVFAAADLAPPEHVIQTDSASLATALIRTGRAVGLVSPKLFLRSAGGTYRFFDVPALRQQRCFSLCYRSRMVLRPGHRRFIRIFAELMAREFGDPAPAAPRGDAPAAATEPG